MFYLRRLACMCVVGLVFRVCGEMDNRMSEKYKYRTIFPVDNLIDDLCRRIKQNQVKSDETVFFPPFLFEKKRGLYGSNIKLNFHGNRVLASMRDAFRVYDNNMFVTAWISITLLEAYAYGFGPKPANEQIQMAVEVMQTFHDKNHPNPNSILSFWSGRFNQSVRTWQSAPQNLLSLFKLSDYLPWPLIEKVLTFFGFSAAATHIRYLLSQRADSLKAFRIPPDFDDSFVNLGLGSLLKQTKVTFHNSYERWISTNSNIDTLWIALKKYAYRPFSSDPNVNTIDPRTYFYIRGFLEQAKHDGKDVALVPTWVQNIEGNRKMSPRGVAMPFNINTVDVTVSANAIYGITASVLSGLVNCTVLDDPDIQKIYLNTTAMLVWEMERDFVGRKDLALTYYTSLMEFYWFVSRTFALLQRHRSVTKETLPKVFKVALEELKVVLRGHVTKTITDSAQLDGDEKVFFDDFLGDGDITASGKPLARGEDRIFTTAMAVNALINVWARSDTKRRQLLWETDTPQDIKDVTQKAATWLRQNTLGGEFKPWNVFFSGSVKGGDSMPFWYPINRLECLNGTKLPLNSTEFPCDVSMGFQGVVSPEDYDLMLKTKHFGKYTPTRFKGYNYGNGSFPFWSSEAYTYASAMLALVQTKSLASFGTEYNAIHNVLPV